MTTPLDIQNPFNNEGIDLHLQVSDNWTLDLWRSLSLMYDRADDAEFIKDTVDALATVILLARTGNHATIEHYANFVEADGVTAEEMPDFVAAVFLD